VTAPKDILDGLVANLQAIPALVLLMGNSASNIIAYNDEWPKKVDLLEAVRDLLPGQMLVAHQETGLGLLGRMEKWKHRFSIYLKPKGTMSAAWFQIVNGIPTTGGGLPMISTVVHPALTEMETPTIRRQFLPVGEYTVFDYFEISITFAERRP
jgi:hypothetical protein